MKNQSIEVVKAAELLPSNQQVADVYVKRYQESTKNALEHILNMGEAVSEIYEKYKKGELKEFDVDYFCEKVNLDRKSSTFRKYKAIGQNANRFREYLHKLPSTFSVLYEMATLDGDEFEDFVARAEFNKKITLDEFKKILNKSKAIDKNNLFKVPNFNMPRLSIAKTLKKVNQFSISIPRDLPESKFNGVVDTLTNLRNEGYIRFDDPTMLAYMSEEDNEADEIDDEERYFSSLKEQDTRGLRV